MGLEIEFQNNENIKQLFDMINNLRTCGDEGKKLADDILLSYVGLNNYYNYRIKDILEIYTPKYENARRI